MDYYINRDLMTGAATVWQAEPHRAVFTQADVAPEVWEVVAYALIDLRPGMEKWNRA